VRRHRVLSGAVTGALAAILLAPASAVAAECRVGGAIGDYWRSIGSERSFLGPCLTGEAPVTGGVVQHFRSGSVYWSATTGAREVHGSIRSAYDATGGPSSVLRLPVTHESPTPSRPGAFNHFQGGSVYWSPGIGAHTVLGAIRARWAAGGWENGILGFPVTSERRTPHRPGAVSHFQGGSVYWSSPTGAHVVLGAIRQAWRASGAENGPLGFPRTDESPTPVKPGAFSHFEGGSAYWSPHTGAHLVHGAIRTRWAEMGWESSWLGFPVSSEHDVPGGRRSDFEGGSIVWDAASGLTRVVAGPRPAFAFTVSPVRAADLPASYRSGCPVGPDRLRLLRLSHVGFDGRNHTGELVVHEGQVVAVLRTFDRLHRARFPIQRMQRVDAFGGSDDASMDANNTSAFNCRRVTGGTAWSEHAYGTALDVNPVQNPYVSGSVVAPSAGRAYLDRGDVRPGMVISGDAVVRAFADNGWRWGGHWVTAKDYQHFSVSGR
jgi:hypothetical protein